MNIPNFFFYIQPNENREKYTFSLGENGIHYTLMYVAHKKAFDFHKKDDNIKDIDNINPYEPFFEMSSFKFLRLLRKLAMIQEYLAKEFIIKNKINIGKLKKYNCWLTAIDNIPSSKHVYTTERKGRMIKSNKKINLEELMEDLSLLHPDEIHDNIGNVFSLFRYRDGILIFQGIIMKNAVNKSLMFWSKKDINYFSKCILVATYNLLAQITFHNKTNLLNTIEHITNKKYKYIKKR